MRALGASRSYRYLMLAGLITSSALQAHHAAAPHYDMDTSVFIQEAVITDFKMVNPHSFVYFDAMGEDNIMANWRCELRPAVVLHRNGWTDQTFAEGQKISVRGHPAWREDNHCLLEVAVFPDGTEIEPNDVLSDAEPERPLVPVSEYGSRNEPVYGQPVNISGDWLTMTRGMGGLGGQNRGVPNQGFDPSAASIAAAEDYDPSFDDPSLHCHPINIIQGWNHDSHVNQITQLEDRVVLTYGFVDFVRTIYLDEAHPDQIAPTVAGHSVGTWQEDVLTVDTEGFLPGVLSHRIGILHSDQLHVTEKFYYEEASGELVRDYILEDPEYLNTPYVGQDRQAASAVPYSPYNCTDLTGVNSIRPEN